jgi:PAS domain S-box-containing protein
VFRAAIEHGGLRLVVDCPPLPEPVYVDREMWEKIVLNLLSNAFKFTFDGEIAVSLRWAGDHVELTVRDTGSGIPAEELPHVFQRVHRVRSVRARTYEGTGIGLALVQELVQLQGGTIGATSVVGQGSTFTVAIPTGSAHLPADRLGAARPLTSTAVGARPYVEEALRWLPGEAEQTSALMEEQGLEGTQALTGQRVGRAPVPDARILLADDNADMRDYLRRLLGQHWTVEAVADGAAALTAARARVPDLVLADVMMPGLDGFALLQALRADPHTRQVPIILLSARAGEEARIEGLEAGADDYLIKPFSSRELLARVGAHLELARVRREAGEWISHILESITDGFVALDREWRFIYLNRHAESFLQRLGHTRQELIGRSIWVEFPQLVGTPFEQHYRLAVAEQVSITFEAFDSRLQAWLEVHAYPAAEGLSIYFRDITTRQRSEAMQAGEKQALQLLAEGETLDTVLAFLVRLIEAQAGDGVLGSILLLDADGRHLRHGAAPSLPAAYTQAIDGLPIGPAVGSCGTAAWRQEPVIVQDIATDPLWAKYRDLALHHGLRACWAMPILSAAGQVLGTFAMYYPRPHSPSADEQHLVDLVTHTAAIAIEHYRAERELRAALREKEVLLQEIHHRVKNNLQVVASLLDMQAEAVADPRVRAAFEDSQARLHAMALIHEQLYQGASLAQLNAADYLRRLSTRLFETYRRPDGRITLELDVEEIALEINVAIPCGLMLNELLSNALKHAFPGGRPGAVAITLRQAPPGTCVLTVRDTGVGLPEGLDIRQTDSLGLQLVSLLITQLEGTLTLERGGGTTFKLTFPLPQS